MGLMQRVATDLQVAVPDVGYAISSYALGVVVGAPLISAFAARVPRRAAARPPPGRAHNVVFSRKKHIPRKTP